MASASFADIHQNGVMEPGESVKQESFWCSRSTIFSEQIRHCLLENCRGVVHPFSAKVVTEETVDAVQNGAKVDPNANDATVKPEQSPGANLLKVISGKPTRELTKDANAGFNNIVVNPVTISAKKILAKRKKIVSSNDNELIILNSQSNLRRRSYSASPTSFKITNPKNIISPPPAWTKRIPVSILDLDGNPQHVPSTVKKNKKQRSLKSNTQTSSQTPKKQFYKIPIGKASQEIPINSKKKSTHTAFITVPRPPNPGEGLYFPDVPINHPQPVISLVKPESDAESPGTDIKAEKEQNKIPKTKTSASKKKPKKTKQGPSTPTEEESSEVPKKKKRKSKKIPDGNSPTPPSSDPSDIQLKSSKPESTTFYGGAEEHVHKKKQSYKIPIQVPPQEKDPIKSTRTAVFSLTKSIYEVSKNAPTISRPSQPGFHVVSGREPKTDSDKKIKSQTNAEVTSNADSTDDDDDEEENEEEEEEEEGEENDQSEAKTVDTKSPENKSKKDSSTPSRWKETKKSEIKDSDLVIWSSKPPQNITSKKSKVPFSFTVASQGKSGQEPITETNYVETVQSTGSTQAEASTFEKIKASLKSSPLLNIMFAGDEKTRILASNTSSEKQINDADSKKPPKSPSRRKSPYQLKSPVESRKTTKNKYKLPAKEFTASKKPSEKSTERSASSESRTSYRRTDSPSDSQTGASTPTQESAPSAKGLKHIIKHLYSKTRSASLSPPMHVKNSSRPKKKGASYRVQTGWPSDECEETIDNKWDTKPAPEPVKRRGVFSAVIKNDGRNKEWIPNRHQKSSGRGDNESQGNDNDLDAEVNDIFGRRVIGAVQIPNSKISGKYRRMGGRDSTPLYQRQSSNYKRFLNLEMRRSSSASPTNRGFTSPMGQWRHPISGDAVSGPSFPRKSDVTDQANMVPSPPPRVNDTWNPVYPKNWNQIIQEKYKRTTSPNRSPVQHSKQAPRLTTPTYSLKNGPVHQTSVSPLSSSRLLSPEKLSKRPGSPFGRISPKTIVTVSQNPFKKKAVLHYAVVSETAEKKSSHKPTTDLPVHSESNTTNVDPYPFSDSESESEPETTDITNTTSIKSDPIFQTDTKTHGVAWNFTSSKFDDISLGNLPTYKTPTKEPRNETDAEVSQGSTTTISNDDTTFSTFSGSNLETRQSDTTMSFESVLVSC